MIITTTREQALQRAVQYNEEGILCSLSFLPTRKHNKLNIEKDINEYVELLDAVKQRGLDSDITLKLMQFGVTEGYDFVKENLKDVFYAAKNANIRIWIDQGLAEYTDDVFRLANEHNSNTVGVCIQAYRSRSEHDILKVENYPIRLVKGFYNDYDIHPWSKVTDNYLKLMDVVSKKSSYPCFATHDYKIIEKAKTLLKDKDGEIQFFAGVRDTLAKQLVKDGYKVRIYLPYGNVTKFIISGLSKFDILRELQRLGHFPRVY